MKTLAAMRVGIQATALQMNRYSSMAHHGGSPFRPNRSRNQKAAMMQRTKAVQYTQLMAQLR